EVIKLGSLVTTNKGSFFIAISRGQITIDNKMYFAIAPNAPIGQLLLGKRAGDTFEFNGNNFSIQLVE
ncbi:MAG: GreA/GreB family elongation factor, partial [Flavobacteriaceae bacterium]|nr:GreA/GreB family elongation factor [Flavobacteriaceae bacterium]